MGTYSASLCALCMRVEEQKTEISAIGRGFGHVSSKLNSGYLRNEWPIFRQACSSYKMKFRFGNKNVFFLAFSRMSWISWQRDDVTLQIYEVLHWVRLQWQFCLEDTIIYLYNVLFWTWCTIPFMKTWIVGWVRTHHLHKLRTWCQVCLCLQDVRFREMCSDLYPSGMSRGWQSGVYYFALCLNLPWPCLLSQHHKTKRAWLNVDVCMGPLFLNFYRLYDACEADPVGHSQGRGAGGAMRAPSNQARACFCHTLGFFVRGLGPKVHVYGLKVYIFGILHPLQKKKKKKKKYRGCRPGSYVDHAFEKLHHGWPESWWPWSNHGF